MDTPQIVIGLLAALVPGLGYVAPVLRWIQNSATNNGLRSALEKTESELILAERLDQMGEHDWAAETRDVAQARPLKILIGFEINRKHRWWTWLTVLGPTVYAVATIIVLVSALNFSPQVSKIPLIVGCVLFLVAISMFLVWAVLRVAWFERRLNSAIEQRITKSKLRRMNGGDRRLASIHRSASRRDRRFNVGMPC